MTIEQALDRCLEEMRKEGVGIQECLARYPQYADELRPLLTLARKLDRANPIRPSREFKAKLRKQLESDADERKGWLAHLKEILAILVLVVLLAALAFGVRLAVDGGVYVSSRSTPSQLPLQIDTLGSGYIGLTGVMFPIEPRQEHS